MASRRGGVLPSVVPSTGRLTRRLRRERWGYRPERGVLSFEAKESTKESRRHGDSGKKASTAHFDGGARYVARSMVGQITHAIVRARSSPFSAVKMGGLFSLRCLSPLCSPAVGVGHTYLLRLGCFATQKREACASPQWTAGRLTHCGAEYYRGNKGQRVFFCTLAFSAR